MESADLLYWLVLPGAIERVDEIILEKLKEREKQLPVFLVVNQVDRYPKPDILPVLEHYHKAYGFKDLIPLSAKTGDQVDLLLQKTYEHLPEGEYLFPEDQISDQSERDIASEIIREKLYHMTKQEIPYATAVAIEDFKEREDGIAEIHATIVVEKDSQKAIVIGKQGQKLKEIGQAARLELEKFLARKVFLKLWVKTLHLWKQDERSLRQLGYR